jgi:hypothetical protein
MDERDRAQRVVGLKAIEAKAEDLTNTLREWECV